MPVIADLTINIYCNRLIQGSLNRKFVMTIWSWSMGFAGKFKMRCWIKYRAALSALLLIAAPSVLALGLGEITLNSSLSEPLDAEIVVLSSENLEEGQLLVSLASPEAFERAGISRDFFYSQMQFSIYRDSDNLRVIRIVTEQPVLEPYLNFLIQLQWPAGRVMREYTLLLDLPIYTDEQQSVTVAPPRQSRVQDKSSSATSQPFDSAAAKTSSPYREPLSGDDHQVVTGDTLWNVAKRLRPSNTTILQTMDSLYRVNADAFVDGDANRIKAGSVLRLPSFDEISVEAGNTVAAQIGLKNPSIASSDLDEVLEQSNDVAANNRAAVQSDQPLVDEGRLELASAFDDDLTAGEQALDDPALSGQVLNSQALNKQPLTGSEGDNQSVYENTSQINQLAEELAVANDEVNKAAQENIELRERLALLEAQVATMVALLDQTDKAAAIPAGSSTANPGKTTVADNVSNQSLAQKLSAVPAYFWLLLIAIISFLLVLLVRKSSKQQEAKVLDNDLPMAGGYEEYGDTSTSSSITSNQRELHALDDLELDPEDNLFDETDTDIFDSDEQPNEAEVFDMMVEAVAEADVYLSLGKTAEAIAVLEEARAEDPADASSRLKLMEVLFRENRKDELRVLYDEIKATGDSTAIEMAAIIIGPDSQSAEVASIANDTLAAELEGLDFQSSEFEDLGLRSVDLADLELDDIDVEGVSFEGSELEDLDLDNLTADDFDIEPAEEQPELEQLEPEEQPEPEPQEEVTADIQQPDSQEPQDSAEAATDDSLMDDFADFDEGSEQNTVDVKLDLAKTYLEMGDPEGAKEILEELIEESDEEGQQKARALLETV